jgi:biopolymer transport protein ExbB/TolQ
VQVAVITGAVSVVIAALSFLFSNLQKRRDELYERKFLHYKELLEALSDVAIEPTDKSRDRLANAMNTIALVAPQKAVSALMAFHDEIKPSTMPKTRDRHDELLVALVIEIRQSLGHFKDNPRTFSFHLTGGKSPLTRRK